jgi:tRNA(fMet)-specific endonuclease VapC
VRLVLDTSVVSAVMRREAAVLDRLRALSPADLVLAAPVAAEIEFGLCRLQEGSRRRGLLAGEYAVLRTALPWADWTEPAALAFGRHKEALERGGTPIGDMDVIIASVATALGCGVATANARDFRRIAGLHVEDWSGG